MNRILLFFLAAFSVVTLEISAQCELTATALPSDITCGTCVDLTAFGEGQGNSVFTESFNSGAPTGWLSTASATYTNPCDPGGVDGTPHLWMGDATGVPRQMTTTAFDFSTASAGATICFDMLFAEQGDASPCEGPDEPDEGVYLQYSTDNGVTWVTIHYFDPNGGNDASLINWNNWCFPIPAAALTTNTQIRWFQDNDSGADYDHWGLDNVNIYFNDPTFNITWQHDGYSYGVGNGGGVNPTQVCPQTTTTYTVVMTNGTTTCTDSVTVNVVPPVFRVSASPDTTLCAGQCTDLIGEASIIVSPAKTPTYENSEIAALTGLPSASDLANLLLPCTNFGGCTCPDGSTVPFLGQCPLIFNATLSMNINITDLNTTSLQSGELTSVCIGDALMLAGDLTPFQVSLTCPSGTSVILANAGDLTGTTLTNTCFDASSTTPVSSGSSPYTGSFQPINPLSNLLGCNTNGVWTLDFTGTFDLSSGTLPVGFLNGWEISFDDPEINYTGIYNWSPTTNMTNETSLTPNVCPTADGTYMLTVVDSAGCSSDSASVNITVIQTNCCPIDIAFTTTAPTCGNSDGSIDVTITNGSGTYGYAWSSGLPATEDQTNLAGGSYMLTVYDSVLACQKDTIINLLAPNSPIIDSIITTPSSCGLSNGSALVFASGGASPYSYSLDGGTTTQVSNTWSGLAGGNYVMTVTDATGCSFDFAFQIDSSSAVVIVDTLIVLPSCGENNGEIAFSDVAGGVEPYQYSIDNGLSFSPDSLFMDLSPGSYNLIVTDNVGCSDTAQINLIADPNAPGINIDSIVSQAPSCGATDGEIEIFTNGPPATTIYSIDGGVSFQPGSIFTGLAPATYDVVVMDNAGCQDSATLSLLPLNAPTIDSIYNADPSCVGGDGVIEIFAIGGTAPLSYSIDNGVSTQPSGLFQNLSAGSYSLVIEDAAGCTINLPMVLTPATQIEFVAIVIVPATCGNDNGEIDVLVSGGNPPFNYSIDNGVSFQSNNEFTNLAPGNYTVLVQEQGNVLCQTDSVVSISNSSAPVINDVLVGNESCDGQNDGTLSILASGGQVPYTVSYNNNAGSLNETGLAPGNYSIELIDNNGCMVMDSATILAGVALSLTTSNDTSAYQGEAISLMSQGTGTSNGIYTWSPATGLSCTDCANPSFVLEDDITYTVSFTDTVNNCVTSEEIDIVRLLNEAFCLFPDAFTPNGDVINDGFGPICEELVYLELKIYNRWGELVFTEESSSDDIRWDGTFKNKQALLDTYVFVATMEFTSGLVETKSGNFTLLK